MAKNWWMTTSYTVWWINWFQLTFAVYPVRTKQTKHKSSNQASLDARFQRSNLSKMIETRTSFPKFIIVSEWSQSPFLGYTNKHVPPSPVSFVTCPCRQRCPNTWTVEKIACYKIQRTPQLIFSNLLLLVTFSNLTLAVAR